MAKRARRPRGEGGLSSRVDAKGQTRWWYQFTGPDGKKVLKRTDEHGQPFIGDEGREAARQALRAALKSADDGTFVRPSQQPLGEFLLKTYLPAKRKLEASSARLYQGRFVKHVIPCLGDVPLAKVTSVKVDEMFTELAKVGLSPASLQAIKTPLAAAFSWAMKQHPPLVKYNPVSGVELPNDSQASHEAKAVWSYGQTAAFLGWADKEFPEHSAMWRLAFATGMRRGELMGLQWGDWDREAQKVQVRRQVRPGVGAMGEIADLKSSVKTGAHLRTVDTASGQPLLDAQSVLADWKTKRGEKVNLLLVKPEAYVFGTLDSPQPKRPNHRKRPNDVSRQFDMAVSRYRREIGADAPPRITIHGTRHTHITWLLNEGVPVKIVAERVGNSPEVITKTYSHLVSGVQAAYLSRIGQAKPAPDGEKSGTAREA